MKFKKDGILISLTFLIIISSPYIQQTINNLIKLIIELIIVTIILTYDKKIDRKVNYFIFPCILFFVSTVYSTFRWSGISLRLINSIVTNLGYLLFFYVLFYQCKKNPIYSKNVVFKNVTFYTIILDFFVLFTKGKGLGGLSEAVYFLGNKFMVSYFHMALLGLLINKDWEKGRKRKISIFLYFIYSVMICRVADTMTGVIGLLFIFLFWIIFYTNKKFYQLLIKPLSVLSFFIGLNALFLLSNVLLQNEFIASFLMKYSHTDTLLSGRLPMYKIVIQCISTNGIWGYGINYDIVQQTLTFGNPQNGLLKMILDYGFIGFVLFCVVLEKSFNCLNKINISNTDFGLVLFIYGMLFCSLIEINLDSLFFFFLALIYCCANSYKLIDKVNYEN